MRLSPVAWLRRAAGAGGPSLLTLALGFLAVVLVANLAAPRNPKVVVEGGAAASEDGAARDGSASPGAAVAPGGAQGGGAPASSDGAGRGGAANSTATPSGGGTAGAAVVGEGQAGAAGGASAADGGAGASTDGGASAGGTDGAGAEPDGGSGEGTAATNGGETDQGVTADTIRVGAGVLDIGALRNLGPAFDNGDVQEQMQAWLEGVRRDGLLPIHGRDIEFTYRTYGPAALDANSQREACAGFNDDDHVFAVIAGSQFTVGSECVAREKRRPVIGSDSLPDSSYQRGAPYLFTLQPSTSRIMRNWAHWMDATGLAQGKTIGVYHFDDPKQNSMVWDNLEPALRSLGYEIAESHTTTDSLGGPQDAVAVNKFQAAGVDLVLLLTAKAGFMRQADNARYYPTYADNDFESGTSKTATTQYPASQWDGTTAMTSMRWGEWASDIAPTQPAQTCLRYFEEKTGRRPDPNEREAEWVALNKACDAGWVLLEGLRRAGPNLTADSFSAAVQSISDMRLGMHLDLTFGQGNFSGFTRQRTLRWSPEGCACWHVVAGSEGPMWVN